MIDFIIEFLLQAAFYLTVALALVTVASIATFALSKITFKEWLAGGVSKGAVASAVLGIGVILGVAAALYLGTALISSKAKANSYSDMFENGTWFNDSSVRLGLDWTIKQSPQCKSGGVDDRELQT